MMDYWRGRIPRILLIVMATVGLSACCGGGGGDSCSATLSYKGTTGPGAGKNKQEAQQGACWKYCIDKDPGVDAAYKRWLASGNKSKTGSKTWDLDEVPALKILRLGCEDQCQRDIAAGKATITFANCK